MRRSCLFAVLAVLVVIHQVCGDVYLHYPPGSNNKNRERNTNRENDKRLFDSQNNDKGGVSWRGDPTVQGKPDPITYYVGSELRIEWTNQHSCGEGGNNVCDVVIQYACNDTMPGLRDGYPVGPLELSEKIQGNTNTNELASRKYYEATFDTATIGPITADQKQQQDGTVKIPVSAYPDDAVKRNAFYYEGKENGIQYGMHEGIDSFRSCRQRQRNKGLYTADQAVNDNAGATATRQNPNGDNDNDVHGLECAEERDYWPYWYPTQWKDIVVMTNRNNFDGFCSSVTSNSQNNNAKYYCDCTKRCSVLKTLTECNCPPTELACKGQTDNEWKSAPSFGIDAPKCVRACNDRENHLGNGDCGDGEGMETPHYKWIIPKDMAGKVCVLRLRYNITSADGNIATTFTSKDNCPANLKDASPNRGTNIHCRTGMLKPSEIAPGSTSAIGNVNPLYNRPYVKLWDSESKLSIALDTNQISRTFQDRSYVFAVEEAPSDVSCTNIYNLNFRGRRGNIVEAYPSIEHDYVPTNLKVRQGDCIHIQLHGSNFEPNQAGEGYQYMSRANLVQFQDNRVNFPLHPTAMNFFNEKQARGFALLGQDLAKCGEYTRDSTDEQNASDNCGKLNASPNRYPPNPRDGLIEITASTGTYWFGNTRSNHFTNRAVKGSITVSSALGTGAVVAIAIGSVAAVGLGAAGVFYLVRKNPDRCRSCRRGNAAE